MTASERPDPGPEVAVARGPAYYVIRNLARKLWARPAGRALLLGGPPLALAALWFSAPLANPWLARLRSQSPALVLAGLTLGWLGLARWALARRARWTALSMFVAAAALWAGLAAYPGNAFRDLSLYGCWLSMDRRPLTELPVTDEERIYPLSMVSRIVEDRGTESHFSVAPFEMQLRGDELQWVAQKTPAGAVNTATLQGVRGVVQVAASSVDVEIVHHDVDFPYGRDLMLPRDLGRFLLPSRLGWLDLFDKQLDTEDLSLLQDGEGRWVMVMAVIDWDGIFPFCVPRFGGVFVCPQRGQGEITWLRPEQIPGVPFLRDQNLVPERVSKFQAESWKFHRGLAGWVRNQGVTRITSIPEDTAQQPFPVFFRDVHGRDGVFQFFALEPEGGSAGLSKMLLVDPRGHQASPPVFFYDFEERGEELVSPARIAETIKASDIHADWRQASGGTFVIAESRPYITGPEGAREFRWFNSIITRDQGSGQPRVVLARPRTLQVDWLEPGQVRDLLAR